MAIIKPFRAMRYTDRAGEISTLCCPPYDIVSEDKRKEYLKANEYNIIRLELPREGEDYYERAGQTLKRFLDDGVLKEDERESVYIYSERFSVKGKDYEFKGIIARVKLEDFSAKVILPHEETLSKAKQDRFDLMKATRCNFSQVYSLYNDENGVTNDAVERLSAGAPDQSFTDDDGVTHSLWIVSDAVECGKICAQFEERKLYIADGHHRYETALNFRNYLRENGMAAEGDECDYIMMMLVPMDHKGLVVFPTHRIVRGLADYDADALIKKCTGIFEIEECDKDDILPLLEKHYTNEDKSFVMYHPSGCALFTLKDASLLDSLCEGKSDAYKSLDVTVLHSLVLERALGIDKENMAKQINLTYTRLFEEAIEAVDSGKANCAFIMNPTKVREIGAVANAGDKMPQKSTYFYPKLITGLVMNKFGEI